MICFQYKTDLLRHDVLVKKCLLNRFCTHRLIRRPGLLCVYREGENQEEETNSLAKTTDAEYPRFIFVLI